MDYAALFLAGTAGLAIGGGISEILNRKLIAALRRLVATQRGDLDTYSHCNGNLFSTLNTLRANAFITNAKGHRVRYVNATPAERARAEGAE